MRSSAGLPVGGFTKLPRDVEPARADQGRGAPAVAGVGTRARAGGSGVPGGGRPARDGLTEPDHTDRDQGERSSIRRIRGPRARPRLGVIGSPART